MKQSAFSDEQLRLIEKLREEFYNSKADQNYDLPYDVGLQLVDPAKGYSLSVLAKKMGVKPSNRESPSQYYERWYGQIWPDCRTAAERRKYINAGKRIKKSSADPLLQELFDLLNPTQLPIYFKQASFRTTKLVTINRWRCRIQTVSPRTDHLQVTVHKNVPNKFDFILVRSKDRQPVWWVIPTKQIKQHLLQGKYSVDEVNLYICPDKPKPTGRKRRTDWNSYKGNWKQLSRPRPKQRGFFR